MLLDTIVRQPDVQAASSRFRERLNATIDLAIAIQQIPAPTFAEGKRADFVQAHFEALGLSDIWRDGLNNVYGRYTATPTTSSAPPVVISAHMDTVFPAGTDLAIRRDGRTIYGPGIGDNSAGVAGLLTLAESFQTFHFAANRDIWFVANIGEEGLGDLKGMRAVVAHFGKEATYLVLEGGLYGQISHQAIGVRRFRVQVNAPGGHSWGSFGNKSAIHELGKLITVIDALTVPTSPKTTYNVGVIEGGSTVNSIAQSASMLLDMRSEDPHELAKLVQKVEKLIAQVNNSSTKVSTTIEVVGDRPAGQIPRHAPLVAWADEVLRYLGCKEISYIFGSTDANIPLSVGATAVCIGLAQSGNAHRLDEYLDPTYLPEGLSQVLLLTLLCVQ